MPSLSINDDRQLRFLVLLSIFVAYSAAQVFSTCPCKCPEPPGCPPKAFPINIQIPEWQTIDYCPPPPPNCTCPTLPFPNLCPPRQCRKKRDVDTPLLVSTSNEQESCGNAKIGGILTETLQNNLIPRDLVVSTIAQGLRRFDPSSRWSVLCLPTHADFSLSVLDRDFDGLSLCSAKSSTRQLRCSAVSM